MNNHIQAGFEVAKEIRKTDSESLIVFISTHTELVLTSYKYGFSSSIYSKERGFSRFPKRSKHVSMHIFNKRKYKDKK